MRLPSDLPAREPRRARGAGHRGRIALIALFVLLLIMFLSARAVSGFYVESTWFSALGRGDVFWGVLRMKAMLVGGFSLAFVVTAFISLTIADRLAPLIRSTGPEDQILDRYRELVGDHQGLVRLVVSGVFGLVAGVPTAALWQQWALFRHAVRFDTNDAQFGTDVGFYVFKLPFLSYLVNWLFASMIVITLLTVIAHYINGGIRLQAVGRRVTPHVKLHLSLLLAILALLKAADYWLQRYALTTSGRGYVDGATYTDVNAQLPAIQLLILISLLAAGLLLFNVRQRGWRLPVIAVGLWAAVAIVAGTAYPAMVQRFQVEPSESSREAKYIVRNIEATRVAFGLDKVVQKTISAQPVTAADVEQASASFSDVRLLDPDITALNFKIDQGVRTGYRFTDLDIDRYEVDGRLQQIVIAARQLDTASSTTWEAKHLAYTHGYGLGFALASSVTADGRPRYTSVVSPENDLGVTTPQIYVGDGLDGYAIVGTNRTGGEESLDPNEPVYSGGRGVTLSSKFRRLAFAVHLGEYNLFGSRLINETSQIIFHRDVRERVRKVAPFLELDADPYPVVLDGRIKWIVDGYTTSDRYPYAERANTRQLSDGSGLRKTFNYVRNPVKAVVDAYDGSVTLYVSDDNDPIVRAWRATFPKLFTDGADMPAELRAHLRYPEDLFRVQTNIYGRYQLTDAGEFYSQQRAWSVAQAAPSSQTEAQQSTQTTVAPAGSVTSVQAPTRAATDSNTKRFDPYYTLFRPQGESDAEFVLLRPYVPFSSDDSRKNLEAVMTASSDPRTYGQLTVYTVQAPQPEGPATVAGQISQDFASELTLLDAAGSEVRFGALQIVPTAQGLVYVRPWFVLAQANSIPTLKSVTVTYADRSALGSSIEEALEKRFPGASLSLGDRQGNGDAGAGTPDQPAPGEPESVEQMLERAQTLYDEAQAAKAAFDSKTYTEKIEQAFELVRQATEQAMGQPIAIGDASAGTGAGVEASTTTTEAPPVTAST